MPNDETDGDKQIRRPAPTDEEVLPVIRQRWSPSAFSTRRVDSDDLAALFEAARWAASISEAFELPDNVEPVTGIAIGYPAKPGEAPEELLAKDRGERRRMKRDEFVFQGSWETPWRRD